MIEEEQEIFFSEEELILQQKVEHAKFKSWIEKNTKNDICMYPNIYLDNYRFCNECPYHKYCLCRIKTIAN